MKESQKKSHFLNPDMLIAYSAILVGLCALVVSIYEANIFRQQQKASVWPCLEFSFSTGDGFSYILKNKGVGPAIIKWVCVKVDGESVKSWGEYLHNIFDGDSVKLNFRTSFISDRVISADEEIKLLSFDDPVAIHRVISQMDRVSFEICYRSIFEDYWIIKSDSSGNKIYATDNYDIDPNDKFQN